MKKLKLVFLVGIYLAFSACSGTKIPDLQAQFSDAKASSEGNRLQLENSKIKRVWRLTDFGLVTESITNKTTGKVWTNPASQQVCDWSYKGLVDENSPGELVNLSAKRSTDEGFTSEHLEVVAEFYYAETTSSIQYKIWVYPGTGGIRTQAFIKSNSAKNISKGKGTTDRPWIALENGKNSNPYAASEVTDLWYASTAVHEKSLELRAFNLDPRKKYKLGLSWWNWKNGAEKQQVRITSVDGEASEIVVQPRYIPDFNGKNEAPEMLSAAVPDGINVDGSIRIYIDNLDGKEATISEVWLLEENATPDLAALLGEEARLNEIVENSVENYGLVAYFDCGTQVDLDEFVASGNADFLPLVRNNKTRRYMGYYNDTQHRNKWSTPIYREVVYNENEAENINWANMLSVETEDEGIMLVKESHKCVNQYGVDTGGFLWTTNGVLNTGTSLLPQEISGDEFKWFWGSWTVVFDGGDDGRELALKQFDRQRFPVKAERDMYTVMCTWGHSKNQRDGRNYATEAEVLKEMDYVAETGIDMLLIDDGWQSSLENKSALPDGGIGWRPHPSTYPDGWKNTIEKSKQLNLKLGLWGIAQQMPASDMIWNFRQIGMRQLKLDFANFGTHDKLNNMMDTVRRFMEQTNHQCAISWDLTENAARYGYYWAREYGNLHFMNRKPFLPMNVLYIPSLALRDFWQLAKYNNLNKYQLVIQNPKVVDHASDAYLYSPEYCVAMALMGVPAFMAVTRFYAAETRASIKSLLDVYKKHRADIFSSYIFPLGNEPSNSSWTGFQSYDTEKKYGYITLFRELNNTEKSKSIQLRFLKNKKLVLENLETGAQRTVETGPDGMVTFEMETPASYRFLRWEVL